MHNWTTSRVFVLWHGVGNLFIITRSQCTNKEEACCDNVALENGNVALHLSYKCQSSKVLTQGPSSLALETFEPMHQKTCTSIFGFHAPPKIFVCTWCRANPNRCLREDKQINLADQVDFSSWHLSWRVQYKPSPQVCCWLTPIESQ